jgi:hypothetical protein
MEISPSNMTSADSTPNVPCFGFKRLQEAFLIVPV